MSSQERPVAPHEEGPGTAREEAAAALAARRELGDEMEPAVVDAFADRVERAIDARIDARLSPRNRGRVGGVGDADKLAVGLALGSLGIAIPLTAIAAGTVGLVAVIIVWIGIVAVNVAYARGRC